MNNQHQQRAARVVESFRNLLDKNLSEQITDSQFQDLTLMIGQAIAEELEIAAEQMAEVVRNLRAQSGKTEIGL